MTTVYIDILFLENFLLDFFVLYITAFALGRRFSVIRGLTASLGGAVYSCSLYISKFSFLENIGFKITVMAFMIFLVFKTKEIFDFIKCSLTFLFMNIVLGGSVFLVNSAFLSSKNGVVRAKNGFLGIFTGTLLVLIFGGFAIMTIKKAFTQKNSKTRLVVIYQNRKIVLDAFSDTGNTLIDPITKASVVVVSKDKLKILTDVKSISEIKNFRLIPCKTVTDKYELLYGFKPDRLLYGDKEINAVIAISKTDFDGEYDAIVNPVTLI